MNQRIEQLNSKLQPTTLGKQTHVLTELDALQSVASVLEEKVSLLEKCLSIVLILEPAQPTCEALDQPYRVDLAQQLFNLRCRISMQTENISSILARLEL